MRRKAGRRKSHRNITLDEDIDKLLSLELNSSGLINQLLKHHYELKEKEASDGRVTSEHLKEKITKLKVELAKTRVEEKQEQHQKEETARKKQEKAERFITNVPNPWEDVQ